MVERCAFSSSHVVGPTDGEQSQTRDVSESPSIVRAMSVQALQDSLSPEPSHMNSSIAPVAFPFNESASRMTTRDLLANLPPKDEAWTLVESYYRYCAWQ